MSPPASLPERGCAQLWGCSQQAVSRHWLLQGHTFLASCLLRAAHSCKGVDISAQCGKALLGSPCPRAACHAGGGLVRSAPHLLFPSLNILSSPFFSLAIVPSKHLAPSFVSASTSKEIKLVWAIYFGGKEGTC